MEAGTRLGTYEIVTRIGSGGMGEVYRARDTRLDRDVAIKVLHAGMLGNAESVARFEREAKALASLNHPNVGGIHGFEEQDGFQYLVLEFVEGETLSDRLAGGPLPPEQALTVAAQVARGLEAAHAAGVIHRDLKPANVMITTDGTAKVLDFGLAKAIVDEISGPGQADSPTITVAHTVAGVVLGTAAYMSPEQARGRPLDKRTDIWSFGVLLYELLTGDSPFRGETVSDSIGAILHTEPDMSRLPAATPSNVRHVLRRCLARDADQRLRDIGDARIELESDHAGIDIAPEAAPQPAVGRSTLWGTAALALIAIAAATFAWIGTDQVAPPRVTRFDLDIERDGELIYTTSSIAVSADGSLFAYIVTSHDSDTELLYVKTLNEADARLVASGASIQQPFFSADGQWIAYFTARALMKVPVGGGSAIELAVTSTARGGTWGPDDTILYAPNTTSPLYAVSADGGEPRPLTTLDEQINERSHRWPWFVPGRSDLVAFTSETRDQDFSESSIEMFDLGASTRHVLAQGGSYGRVTPDGDLLFVRGGTLYAGALTTNLLAARDEFVPVAYDVVSSTGNGGAQLAFSDSGTLIYAEGADVNLVTDPTWVDFDGTTTVVEGLPGAVRVGPAISPDGTRLAFHTALGKSAIYVLDLERELSQQLFPSDHRQIVPVWSPDGTRIAFSGETDDNFVPSLSVANLNSEQPPIALAPSNTTEQYPSDWFGDWILFDQHVEGTQRDIFVYDLGTDEIRTVVSSPGYDIGARFDPTGEWIAFVSDLSGQNEIYLRRVDGEGGRQRVSALGGMQPRWAPDGSAIYYLEEADGLERFSITRAPVRFVGTEARLASVETILTVNINDGTVYDMWDLHPDGDRLVAFQSPGRSGRETRTQVRLVLNWFDELDRLLEAAGSRR